MSQKSEIVVVYHRNCNDGFTAAWVCSKSLAGNDVKWIAANYSDKDPSLDVFESRDVYIVDFSYRREVLEHIHSVAKSLIVLDHHKTAEENLKGLDYCIFDMTKCGARLAWEHFNQDPVDPDTPIPLLVEYIEDADLYKWMMPHSKEVNSVIRSHQHSFDTWDGLHSRLSEGGLESLVAEGEAIQRYRLMQIELAKSQVFRQNICGFDVPCVNISSGELVSDTLHDLAKGEPFAASMSIANGTRVFSLRSVEGGEDVSEIARALGGGGHKHAAGFSEPYSLDMEYQAYEILSMYADDDNWGGCPRRFWKLQHEGAEAAKSIAKGGHKLPYRSILKLQCNLLAERIPVLSTVCTSLINSLEKCTSLIDMPNKDLPDLEGLRKEVEAAADVTNILEIGQNAVH